MNASLCPGESIASRDGRQARGSEMLSKRVWAILWETENCFFVVVVAVPLSVLIGSAFVNDKKRSDRNKWHKNINKQDYKYKLASWYNFCWVSSFAKGFSNVINLI